MIKNNLQLSWNINIFYTLLKIKNVSLLFGALLMTSLMMLFILKYDRDIRLKLSKLKKSMPDEDGSFEYGSFRWATKNEIRKNYKTWNINSKLKSGGVPVTYMDGKFYYSDKFDHTLIIGSTRSGKTISCILPLIFNLANPGESMVINDTKGELYSYSANYLKIKDMK